MPRPCRCADSSVSSNVVTVVTVVNTTKVFNSHRHKTTNEIGFRGGGIVNTANRSGSARLPNGSLEYTQHWFLTRFGAPELCKCPDVSRFPPAAGGCLTTEDLLLVCCRVRGGAVGRSPPRASLGRVYSALRLTKGLGGSHRRLTMPQNFARNTGADLPRLVFLLPAAVRHWAPVA